MYGPGVDQPLFGVVTKALHGVAADAFFTQASEAVVAVAFVFKHLHVVVLGVAARTVVLQQVGGSVVVVGLTVQFRIVRVALAVVAQTLSGVVNIVFVALDTFAVALAEDWL